MTELNSEVQKSKTSIEGSHLEDVSGVSDEHLTVSNSIESAAGGEHPHEAASELTSNEVLSEPTDASPANSIESSNRRRFAAVLVFVAIFASTCLFFVFFSAPKPSTDILKQATIEFARGRTSSARGSTADTLKWYESARKKFEQGIQESLKDGNAIRLLKATHGLASVYLAEKNFSKGMEFALHATRLTKKLHGSYSDQMSIQLSQLLGAQLGAVRIDDAISTAWRQYEIDRLNNGFHNTFKSSSIDSLDQLYEKKGEADAKELAILEEVKDELEKGKSNPTALEQSSHSFWYTAPNSYILNADVTFSPRIGPLQSRISALK